MPFVYLTSFALYAFNLKKKNNNENMSRHHREEKKESF